MDISNLSNEKQQFLRANSELLKSLEKTIPTKISKAITQKNRINKGKSKLQRELAEIDRVFDEKHNPDNNILMKLNQKKHDLIKPSSKMICPKCKEADYGNKVNGISWCVKCDTALISSNKLEKWKKLPEVKYAPDALKNELHRLNPGLNPDNREEL